MNTQVPIITADQANGLVEVVMANSNILIPVGITILGVMLGISLIPRVIYKFF